MATVDQFQRAAGVADPTWSPPGAPEDGHLKHRVFDFARAAGWPDWVTSPGPYDIGSCWRLRRTARIVAPAHCAYPTLALTSRFGRPDRYMVKAGTRFTLIGREVPADQGQDLATYYAYSEGWAMRIYRIKDGSSAGIRLYFSADSTGDRFPFSSRLAHAALELVDAPLDLSVRWSPNDLNGEPEGVLRKVIGPLEHPIVGDDEADDQMALDL